MSERKYFSEFGLNMINGRMVLLQQEDLGQVSKLGIDPHLYIIGRRPKITLEPKSVKFIEDKVVGRFQKQIMEKHENIPFEVPNLLGTSDVRLQCEYPYMEYSVYKGNDVIAKGKCALLLAMCGPNYWEHLDMEVLYVGQSYGKGGSRSASDRLQSHSTLQAIYAEAIKNSPDQDIWLILSTFEPMMLASFDGSIKNYATTTEEDNQHIEDVVNTDITEQQQINFTEAALIKYFQPPYNDIYKNSFPNPAHSTYSECYDLDLNMVCVEFQTEELRFRLWSESVKPKWIHFCSFPLHSREDRIYMFDFDGQNAL